ncbi:MAG: serine hydrolase domain-containing protein, partial [Luteibaculum sp.]
KAPKEITVDGKTYPFEEFLATNKSVALLIIHKDSIHFEEYWRNYSEESIVPSFSMAKSVLSILVGCAIEDGLIPSVDIPVTKYIPELKGKGFDKVSIEQVLQMTSGLDYKESYTNPFGDAATFYYGRDLRKAIFNMELEVEPGTRFSYQSGNPQILGLVLDRALGDKTISDYMEEKLWKPLEMEYNASWSLDKKKNGLEKTFCCLNARARDFAKIGRLYLHGGRFKDKQIVPEEWVKKSTQIDTTEASAWYYQYQWWLPSREGDFMAQGILGQYIYVNPAKDLVIVRLGKSTNNMGWSQIFRGIAAAY